MDITQINIPRNDTTTTTKSMTRSNSNVNLPRTDSATLISSSTNSIASNSLTSSSTTSGSNLTGRKRSYTSVRTIKFICHRMKCSICFNKIKGLPLLKCQHEVCSECLPQLRRPFCPICNLSLKSLGAPNNIIEQIEQNSKEDEKIKEHNIKFQDQ
jgi:hypothetical protein